MIKNADISICIGMILVKSVLDIKVSVSGICITSGIGRKSKKGFYMDK